jgi:primosomal protein N' (replication factor Y)
MFADIILPLNMPQVLTYGVPIEMQDTLKPGMRVEVALGKNKQYSGIVECLHNDRPETYMVKPVRGIIDKEPVVNELQLKFWRWIGDYYMAAPGEVMQAALPAHLKLMGETRLQWIAEPDVYVEWSAEAWLAVDALQIKTAITITELREIVGARYLAAVLNELLEHEAVRINEALEQSYKPRKERIVVLAEVYEDEKAMMYLFEKLQRAPKQLELLMAYTELKIKHGFVRQTDLLDRAKATAAQLKALADKDVFFIREQEIDRLPASNIAATKEVAFTPVQQTAYDELNKGLTEKNVALLQGVTGSGKTLLYIHKIREALAQGKQAILLLPEIAVTTQLVSRLIAYFGDDLGVYHSHFSNNERVEIWEKVRKGIYKVVVGPRSALWLPYSSLGIVIVDEEHDGSYKQRDPAPRFNARDAAIYLANLYDSKVILGSATPSLESLYNVQQGKYAYASLKERYMGLNMPQIELVNPKVADPLKDKKTILSPLLQEAIADALKNKKQVILFQNRRGYTPFQQCTVCGWIPQCTNCAVSLTYHKSTGKLHCHYCGLKAAPTQACPQCASSSMTSKSFGTEKVEEEVQQLFPKAKVARMDVDSMRNKNSITELFDKLEKHKIDILVGTQMVVKGLDLASVSLVGIISADSILSYPDFRVNERAFQLMEQVSGRAGRADGAGKVLIQTYNLTHPTLHMVKEHSVSSFYRSEIKYREQFAYPPFSRLIKIVFRHRDEAKAMQAAGLMAEALQKVPNITVQGPGPAIIARVRDQYIQEIWLKCPKDNKLIDTVKDFLKAQRQHILNQRGYSNVQIVFDVDPA